MTAAVASVVESNSAHAEYQAARLAIYQRELALAGGDPRLTSPVGMVALQEVLEDIERLLEKTAREQLALRFPGQPVPDLLEECVAEARVACIAAAQEYEPGPRSFHNWVTDKQSGRAVVAIRSTIARETRSGDLTKGQEIVVRYAHGILTDLRTSGLEPAADELTELVRERCTAWATDQVKSTWRKSGRDVPADDDSRAWLPLRTELEEAAESKLKKNGISAALRDVTELLRRADRPAAYDPTLVDAGAQTIAGVGHAVPDEVSDLARVAVCAMSAEDRQLVWARMFGEDGGATAADRRTRAKVDALLELAQAQLRAPHAHFAALSPTIELQFEQIPAADAHSAQALRGVVRRARLDPDGTHAGHRPPRLGGRRCRWRRGPVCVACAHCAVTVVGDIAGQTRPKP